MAIATGMRASIYVLATEEGGRRTPFISGYRPTFDFGYFTGRVRSLYDGAITLEDSEMAMPGSEYVIRVRFFYPEYLDEVRSSGDRGIFQHHRRRTSDCKGNNT